MNYPNTSAFLFLGVFIWTSRVNDVLALAKRNSQVLITFDKDFASPDLYHPTETTGIIVLRVHPPKLKSIQLLLKNLLDSVPVDKFSETLFVATETGVEIIQT